MKEIWSRLRQCHTEVRHRGTCTLSFATVHIWVLVFEICLERAEAMEFAREIKL